MIDIAYISADKIISELEDAFIDNFHEIPSIVSAPGRVNFIGEHMDYNMGSVLLAAINQSIFVAISPNEDNTTRYIFLDIDDGYEGDINHLEKSDKKWPNYINSIVDQLIKQRYKITGFNCVIKSNIPIGTSASMFTVLECAVLSALNEIFEFKLDKLTIVKMAQKAEHEFIGVHTGILVYFAVMFGKKNYAIQLDCRTLEYKYIHMRMDEYRIVMFDAGVNRAQAGAFAAFNYKRETCERCVALLNEVYPQVLSLRDATVEMLDAVIKPIGNQPTYELSRYIVEEIERIQQAGEDLLQNNLKAFGKKMFASHDDLSKKINVSSPELDFLIDFVKGETSVIGARMMGAEFGGSTVNIIREDAIQELLPRLSHAYEKEMKKELKAYIYETAGGVTYIQ